MAHHYRVTIQPTIALSIIIDGDVARIERREAILDDDGVLDEIEITDLATTDPPEFTVAAGLPPGAVTAINSYWSGCLVPDDMIVRLDR